MLSRRGAPIMAARRNYARQFAPDSEHRPESASSRSAWDLDAGEPDVPSFSRQKSTGIDMQNEGGAAPMVTTHEALGINNSWLSKFGRGVRSLWGTRLTEDSSKSDIKIKTTLRELIVYIVFLLLLLIATFGMVSTSMFYYTTAIDRTFLQTSGSGVAFVQMSTMEDVWKFLEGPLMDGLYPEQWYNDRNFTSDELGYVLHENRLLGSARLRQVRVQNDSCIVADDFSESIHGCYDAFYSGVEDKHPFGVKNGTAWTYMSEDDLDTFGSGYSGEISSYGGGGYTQVLPPRYSEAKEVIQTLKDNLWIDRGTRAVFVDFTVYNANINLFCVVRLVAELPATGGVVPSWSLRTVKLLRYVTPGDYFVLACEIMFMLFIVYYCVEEFIEIKKVRLAYFKSFWNILDIVVILIAVCCVIFSIYRSTSVNSKLDSLLQNPEGYPDFTNLSFWQITFNSALAVMVFICWVKVFKYISFNRTMTQLSSTLSKCAKDLAGFAVMFFIFFLAFAQLGYLLFGTQIEEYSSFTQAIFTLFRLILGDFDFPALQQANRILGPMFFCLYIFFVFFILLNMFLAIINDTYAEVKSDIADQQNEFEMGDFFRKGAFKMLERLNIKREKIADIQDVIHEGDINKDGVLDFEEWRTKMKKRGYADAEIEAVFAKYDADGDNGLNLGEQGQMQRDLENQKGELDSAYDQIQESSGGAAAGSSVDNKEMLLIYRRMERTERSVSGLAGKVDSILTQLERIERAKNKRRETMSTLLETITETGAVPDESRRLQMLRLVRDELSADVEDSDADFNASGSGHGLLRPRSAKE